MEKQLLDKEIVDLLNYRIQQEQFSSRIYEQIAMWFDNKGYLNLKKLYEKYAGEELTHAGWAKEFLLSYGIQPTLKPLNSPDAEYKDSEEIFQATLEHEEEITRQVSELTKKALTVGLMTLYTLGLKYCAEQIEELNKAINLIDIHKLSPCELVMDQYVGENLL